MKKKLMAMIMCVCMSAALMACGGSDGGSKPADNPAGGSTQQDAGSGDAGSGDASGDASEVKTLKDGVLMVGMEIGYPPMEYFDTDGSTPIGFDVEVAKALADQLGLEVEYVDTAWDGIFAGVDTDKYDCIISSVSITDARKETFNLTRPYVSNHTALIVPNDSAIDSMEALAGHSTAVQAETTSDDYMKEHGEELGVELFQYDKVINCFDDLKAGRTDSVFTDSVVAAYYLGDEAVNYKTVWDNPDLEPIGICLKKGNDGLTAAIENALDELADNGTLGEIAVKYFGTDLTEGIRN